MDEEVGTLSEYEPYEEMLNALSSLILTILFLPVIVVHTFYVYQDLFTPLRKSLNHRRKKVYITVGYKRTNYLTVSCIWFFCLALFGTALQYNFTIGRCSFFLTVIEKVGYFGSKMLLYLTYILRLNEVYSRSAFGYSEKSLKCTAIAVIIWVFALFIFTEILFILVPHTYQDTDGKFPYYCQITAEDPWKTFVGGGILLFDIIASISAVVLFRLPLTKVTKAASDAPDGDGSNLHNSSKNKLLGKMMYAGTKYMILVWSASFFTLLWIVVMMVGAQSYASFLIIFDFVVNPVSLILMAPYYPSNVYYERICCLCIKCCDRSVNKYKSQAAVQDRSKKMLAELSVTNTETDPKSRTDVISKPTSLDSSRAPVDPQKAVPLPQDNV
eukprot:82423_1